MKSVPSAQVDLPEWCFSGSAPAKCHVSLQTIGLACMNAAWRTENHIFPAIWIPLGADGLSGLLIGASTLHTVKVRTAAGRTLGLGEGRGASDARLPVKTPLCLSAASPPSS